MAIRNREHTAASKEDPTVFEAAHLAYEGRMEKTELCEVLLVGRCKENFKERIRSEGTNGKSGHNGDSH